MPQTECRVIPQGELGISRAGAIVHDGLSDDLLLVRQCVQVPIKATVTDVYFSVCLALKGLEIMTQ